MAHGKHYRHTGKPKETRKVFFRLIGYLAKDKHHLFLVGFLIVLGISCNLIGSYMLRPIINNYIIPGNYNGLLYTLISLAAIYLIGVLAVFIQYRMLNIIGQRTVNRMRIELFSKMETLPIRYFDMNQHGDLMSRYTNDIDQVSVTLTDSLADILTSLLTLIGVFSLMIYISPILTLVTLITIPLMFVAARTIAGKSRKYFQSQQKSLGDANGYMEEMISGQQVIKVFGHEKQVVADFELLNRDLQNKSEKAQFYSGLMMPVMHSMNTLSFVLVTIAGALLAMFRGFDLGGLAAFLQYSRQFGRPINDIASLYNSIQAALAGAERIFQVIDEDPEEEDKEDAIELKDIKGNLEMKKVYFGYTLEKTILKNISFQAQPGQKIALVGETGAGKTTILNMLPRFFDIHSGTISIDDVPINQIKRSSLRRSMAIVLQETHLFTGTVCDNIRFGRLDATDEDVINAAKLTVTGSKCIGAS